MGDARGTPEIGQTRREVRPLGGKTRAIAGTGGCRVHGDARPGRETSAIGGRNENSADDLVPQQQGLPENGLSCGSVHPVMEVRATNSAIGDRDHGFIGRRNGFGEFVDTEIILRVDDNAEVGLRQ